MSVSGCAAELDNGQMLPPVNVADLEPDLVATDIMTANSARPEGSRLDLSPLAPFIDRMNRSTIAMLAGSPIRP